LEKPFMKASNKYFALRARGKLYPRVRGVVMAPVDHPYGGKSKRPRGKAVPRTAPPGAKIGSIAPRRMGKKKGK
jgi:large subunit ribosomal protein L2